MTSSISILVFLFLSLSAFALDPTSLRKELAEAGTAAKKEVVLWRMYYGGREYPSESVRTEIIKESFKDTDPEVRTAAARVYLKMTADYSGAIDIGLQGNAEVLREAVIGYRNFFEWVPVEKSMAERLARVVTSDISPEASKEAAIRLGTAQAFTKQMKTALLTNFRNTALDKLNPGVILATGYLDLKKKDVERLQSMRDASHPQAKSAEQALIRVVEVNNPAAVTWLESKLVGADSAAFIDFVPHYSPSAAKALIERGTLPKKSAATQAVLARSNERALFPISAVQKDSDATAFMNALGDGHHTYDHDAIDLVIRFKSRPENEIDRPLAVKLTLLINRAPIDKLFQELKSEDQNIRDRAAKSLCAIAEVSSPSNADRIWTQLLKTVFSATTPIAPDHISKIPKKKVSEFLRKMPNTFPEAKQKFARALLGSDLPVMWSQWAVAASTDGNTPYPSKNLRTLFNGESVKSTSGEEMREALLELNPPFSEKDILRLIEMQAEAPSHREAIASELRDIAPQLSAETLDKIFDEAAVLVADPDTDIEQKGAFKKMLPLLSPERAVEIEGAGCPSKYKTLQHLLKGWLK